MSNFEQSPPIWPTEPYNEFGVNIETDTELADMKEVIENWAENISKSDINAVLFQYNLSRHMLHGLENYHQKKSANEATLGNTPQRAEQFYRQLFQELRQRTGESNWNFGSFRVGYLTEYAVAKAFGETGAQVFYSKTNEDMQHKIDWWVKSPQNPDQIIAVQVKYAGEDLNDISMFSFPKKPKWWELIAHMPKSEKFKQRENKFVLDCNKMSSYCQHFSNVMPLVIFVPARIFDREGNRYFDSFDHEGLPGVQLQQRISARLETILKDQNG